MRIGNFTVLEVGQRARSVSTWNKNSARESGDESIELQVSTVICHRREEKSVPNSNVLVFVHSSNLIILPSMSIQ
ncbi:hypothetical protein MPTK2_3g08030 [Marchantia polymorpha subsp. ruderalis]